MDKESGVERILWSIAIPGFGQLLNGKYIKAFVLIALEILINTKANLNMVIISSFYGETLTAVRQTNYHWLMFYPCFYMFVIWDAYKDGVKERAPFSFLPFAVSAYFGTIGVIYSRETRVMGILLGPVWLPILAISFGVFVGFIIQDILVKQRMKKYK